MAHYYLHLVKCGVNLSICGNGFIMLVQGDFNDPLKYAKTWVSLTVIVNIRI